MKVESTNQYAANTVVFENSDDIFLRLLGNGDGLMPIWYILDKGSFDWVHNSHDLDVAWAHRSGGV